MRVQYSNHREDFEALARWVWRLEKEPQRQAHYFSMLWHTAFWVLGFLVSWRAEQLFVTFMFATAAVLTWMPNWSFEQKWRKQVAAYAQGCTEYTATLLLDEEGLTEEFLGIHLFLPWKQVRDYAETDGRLVIAFLPARAFVIPHQCLSEAERMEFLSGLRSHGVRGTIPQPAGG